MKHAKGTLAFLLRMILQPGIWGQEKAVGGENQRQLLPIARPSQTNSGKPETRWTFEEKLLGTLPAEYEFPPATPYGTIVFDNPARWAKS